MKSPNRTIVQLKKTVQRNEEMSRSDAQKLSAEFMTEAEKETETDRLVRKSKQQPFIPIGELSDRACISKRK